MIGRAKLALSLLMDTNNTAKLFVGQVPQFY